MSDLFFLYFVPLCFLLPICFFLVLFLLSKRKKKMRPSPGSALGPAHTNPILKDIADRLFEEIGLPSQDFRREMGVKYPDLAMAFRQSVNFGLIRYTKEFWNCEPDPSIKVSIINRLICDYFGLIIPRQSTLSDVRDAFALFFKQKKMLYKVSLETVDSHDILIVTDKNLTLFTLDAMPVTEVELRTVLTDWATAIRQNPEQELRLFRTTTEEYGFVIVTPQEYQHHLHSYEQVLTAAAEN